MGHSTLEGHMRIDWDVEVAMDDGVVLRADVFRPSGDAPCPVLLTYGPYAKGLAFQIGYPSAWTRMVQEHPDVAYGSTNRHQNWEVVDPEKWVPHGYICVRVDSRGTGRSPGFIDHFSPRETQDYYDCIEWAGMQPWCNGKVGLSGVSYYGINQWQVASRQPPHLAAMCIWEGAADWYRDMTHHGGILSTFWANWYDMQVKTVQYGLGARGPRSPVSGMLVCGDETLGDDELARNRASFGDDILAHPLDGDYHRARSPDWSRVNVPFLSAANWGGQGLHPRGNFEAFMRAASKDKWLEAHGLEHWTHFYTDYGRDLQLRFFDHFLKGEKNGWGETKRVTLQVRHVDRFEQREENEWPLARSRWTKFYLDGDKLSLEAPKDKAAPSFQGFGDGLTFLSVPMSRDTEITGPLSAHLRVASTTEDADLFLVFRVFSSDMREVTFMGAIDPHTPVAQGWLRASHRKIDQALTKPWWPYHAHDEVRPLTPGIPVDLDIELWPTSIVVPAGYRIALSVRGKDYEWQKTTGTRLSNFKNELLGCGPFLHNDPRDRPAAVFDGVTTLHIDAEGTNYILLPIID
ncbi:MAG: peptidase [Hyphomicrobiales bacterium]|nr:peptidase [Hyphomicrobiales bacterium]